MIQNKLEQYYSGDSNWIQFASYYKLIPNTMHTIKLIRLLNNDELLAKVIEGLIGEKAINWIMKQIPALDNLRPIDCISTVDLLYRLRTMLMRM